jgi:succinyl-diaminopimelate desuccinylase
VPESCVIDIEIRYLPGQSPEAILEQVGELSDVRVVRHFSRVPAIVDRNNPFVRVLMESVSGFLDEQPLSVGRDGASDAICFIEAGIPAIEFGPVGAGHHGPGEWLSIPSLDLYRHALVDFVRLIPKRLGGALRIA